MILIELTYNLSLLVALCIISGFVEKRYPRIELSGPLIQGFLFGIVAIIGMMRPLIFSEGLIFDGRSVVLSLAAFFFGPVPGSIAGIMAIIFRITLGGSGELLGTLVIISSVIIGTIFHFYRKKNYKAVTVRQLLYLGFAVHISMLLLMFLLPYSIAISIIQQIGIPIIISYPLATILIGKILSDQEENARHFKEIKNSEVKYRYMFANNPQPMFIYDLETLAFLEVNDAALNHYGYTKEEFLSMTLKDIRPPEDIEALMKDVELTRYAYNPAGQWRHIKKNGENINVEIISHSITFNNRKARHVMVYDITKRKQAEEALSNNEARLHTLVQTIPDLVWLKDTNGVFLSCNSMFERFLGAKEADIIGKTDYDFVNRELADFFRKNDQIAMEAGKPTSNEEWITFANESQPILIETIKTPMYDDQGKLIGVLGIGRDITERKRAEQNLISSENKYRTIFDSAPVGIYQSTLEGNFIQVNIALANMLGYESVEELRGKNLENNIYFDKEERRKLISKFETLGSVADLEIQWKKKDGTLIWVQLNSIAVKDDAGITKHFEGFVRDITERKKSEEQITMLAHSLRSINESVSVTDLEDKIIFVNESFMKTYGYSEEELIGQYMPIIRSSNNPSEVVNEILPATMLGGWHGELWNKRKDGSEFQVHLSTTTIKDRSGKILGLVGIAADITEHKKAEEELLKLYIAVEQSPASVIITNPEGNIEYVNKKFNEISGYKNEEVIGKNPSILKSGLQDKKFYEELWTTILSGIEWKGEMQNKKKNGDLYWQSAMISPLVNNDGDITHFIAINEDITEQKKTRAALLVSEERYKSIFNNSVELVYIFDLQGNLLEANKMTLTLLGYTSEEAKKLNISNIIDPVDLPAAINHIEYIVANGANKNLHTYLIRTKKGNPVFIETTGVRLDKEGKPYGIMSIARNITLNKQAENALQESEKKYRNLFEKMLDGVYKSTHNGKFIQVNNAMVKLLGYNSKEEVYDLNIKTQVYFQDGDRESAALEEKHQEMAIFRLKKKDGTEVWVEDHGRHVLDDSGNILYHEGVMRDVTERLKIEEELIQAKEKAEEMNRLKTSFLANMSHELRTPLIGILGYAEFLENELKDEELLQMVMTIKTSGQRLNTTLNNILDISRIESEKQKITLQKHDIIKIIIQQAALFIEAAEEKGLSLKLEIKEKILNAFIDEEMFVSIISNLLSNAIKFTKNGNVTVITMRQGDNAIIEVKDTGIGVSADYQKIIFDPFRQASEGFSRGYEGTGLGLTIVKKYVDLMDGMINLRSTPGKGSTFRLQLPINQNTVEDFIDTNWV